MLVRLTLIAPEIVEAVLDGRQTLDMTPQALLGPSPVQGDQQHKNEWV